MKTVTQDWDWWAYLFRVTHREQIEGITHWDDRLVEFLVAVLRLEPGMRVLDVACGSGVHLLRLAVGTSSGRAWRSLPAWCATPHGAPPRQG